MVCLGLGCACGPKEEDTTASGGTTGETVGTSGDQEPTGGETGGTEPGGAVPVGANRQVDLLFVIDNSGSMAEEQALLVKNLGALLAALEGAEYRIGVTTTDSGNPRCPSATYTPEGGKLVLSSCIDRVAQGEFAFISDDFSATCTDFCSKPDSELSVKGTPTAMDPQAAPRKWVQREAGQLNIGGVEALEALQCYLPQGVAGCGFESHLESMYLALAQAQSQASKDNYGFVRDEAQLAVVFVSDETDCSYNQATKEIFTTNKVFWNDPDFDTAPTSAMCWRAGVACTGGPGTYSECHPQDFGTDGAPVDDVAQAVLQPVSKYVDFVKQIEARKQSISAAQRVKVSLLTGVPQGYESFDAEIQYEDLPADDQYQINFGIGPGCVLGSPDFPETMAVPPVRERAFAEAFAAADTRPLYSLCADSYSAALAAIGQEIADGMVPSCMPYCVADSEPNTAVVEASCEVRQTDAYGNETVVPPCIQLGGVAKPPNGAQVCYAARVDPDGSLTPSAIDDMSAVCVGEGFNLEIEVVRLTPAPAGAVVAASCVPSANKAQDCPNL